MNDRNPTLKSMIFGSSDKPNMAEMFRQKRIQNELERKDNIEDHILFLKNHIISRLELLVHKSSVCNTIELKLRQEYKKNNSVITKNFKESVNETLMNDEELKYVCSRIVEILSEPIMYGFKCSYNENACSVRVSF